MKLALPNPVKFKRHKGSMAVAIGGTALMVVIIATGPETAPANDALRSPVVPLVEARPSTVQLTVTTHGVVLPKDESPLISEVAGRILLAADSMVSGGFFQRGDVLVSIDPTDYELALEQAHARLTSATSELDKARRAFVRQDQLTGTDVASESKRDEAENRQLFAEASVRELTAQLKRAERDLERTKLLAPYDGRVRNEQVESGQFVNRGQVLANLYSVDFAEVRLPVHDEDLALLPVSLGGALDATARLEVLLRARFAGNEHVWRGHIVRTEGEIDPDTRMVRMVAQVPRPYHQPAGKPPLTVGLFVEAEIQGREVKDVSVLPRSALQSEREVHVVGEDGRLAVREVEVVHIINEEAYVLGLHAGEHVAAIRLRGAIDGLIVQTTGGSDRLEPGA